MRLLVQRAVYGRDGAHAGPTTPPVAYEYRVVEIYEVQAPEDRKVSLPADERVVWVLP